MEEAEVFVCLFGGSAGDEDSKMDQKQGGSTNPFSPVNRYNAHMWAPGGLLILISFDFPLVVGHMAKKNVNFVVGFMPN